MALLGSQLDLARCPHCNVDQPNLTVVFGPLEPADYLGQGRRFWKAYKCSRCGGLTLAFAFGDGHGVQQTYPAATDVDSSIPDRARSYLRQAFNTLHAPAGAVMLAASAVDAMLKARGYKEGSLYSRIDKATADHLITKEMAEWAHQVRLDANEQRHSDEEAPEPDQAHAQRAVEFASALGQFMFVLPGRVEKGLKEAEGAKK